MTFIVETVMGYDGPAELPLNLKVISRGFEKDYPVAVRVDLPNMYLVLGGAGAVLLLFLIIIIMIAKGGKKKKKDDDYEFKMK